MLYVVKIIIRINTPLNAESRTDLYLAAAEKGLVQGHGGVDRVLVRELDVGEALGVAVELVAEDRDPVDAAAAVKVGLQLVGRGAVIHVAHVHGAGVHLQLVGVREVGLRRRRGRVPAGGPQRPPQHQVPVHLGLHVLELHRLLLHLPHPGLDGVQLLGKRFSTGLLSKSSAEIDRKSIDANLPRLRRRPRPRPGGPWSTPPGPRPAGWCRLWPQRRLRRTDGPPLIRIWRFDSSDSIDFFSPQNLSQNLFSL